MSNNEFEPPREIDISESARKVVVVRGDLQVVFNTDGSVDVFGNVPVALHPSIYDKVGDLMPEGHSHVGWIYGGISKTTNQPFYIAPKDSGVFKWNEAMEFAAGQNARLPSDNEIKQIYRVSDRGALQGSFNEAGQSSWYWSSTEECTPHFDEYNVYAYCFGPHGQSFFWVKPQELSVRLVMD